MSSRSNKMEMASPEYLRRAQAEESQEQSMQNCSRVEQGYMYASTSGPRYMLQVAQCGLRIQLGAVVAERGQRTAEKSQ